ncbi:MAG: class I SAM-dependent methyltransferase [Trueperaceae bacterium]
MNLGQFLLEYHALANPERTTRSLTPSAKELFARVPISTTQFVDMTGGGFALRQRVGLVLASSRASLRRLQPLIQSFPDISLQAGAPWDAPKNHAELIFLEPQTDKGNVRVLAELKAASSGLKMGGVVYWVMHKDQGAKRYEAFAKELFADAEVIAKEAGWRLCKAMKDSDVHHDIQKLSFTGLGLTLQAEPGVYAAGKLDPGTAFLLETYDISTLGAKKVLDLGCGYGLLALKAALADAAVTALDDDLCAVRSTHLNAAHYGCDVRVLHSDVNSELHEDERFDVVLMNPPFHVAKHVVLDVPHAFIAAAYQHLRPGGELVLVANKALAYEALLEAFAYWEVLASNTQFKVLRAIR